MNEQALAALEIDCWAFLKKSPAGDSAHDISHIARVLSNARAIHLCEGGNQVVVVLGALLHDCVSVRKDSKLRAGASRLAAEKASEFLTTLGLEQQLISQISHAIEAHSFSAQIAPETLEAKIVQDADRLDALGAIGIARCLLTGGKLDRPLYDIDDPFCVHREPDDAQYTLDHFYTKLLKLTDTMQTPAGRSEAQRRCRYMQDFLDELGRDIGFH